MELYLQKPSLFLSVIFSLQFDLILVFILILTYTELMLSSNIALVFYLLSY